MHSSTGNSTLIPLLLMDGAPLVILLGVDTKLQLAGSNFILDWYAEKYDIDRQRLGIAWMQSITYSE